MCAARENRVAGALMCVYVIELSILLNIWRPVQASSGQTSQLMIPRQIYSARIMLMLAYNNVLAVTINK